MNNFRPRAQRGFTLIEMMVTVAIIGIISAIAYPSYSNYVQKTRRSAAAACLVEWSQWMERNYTLCLRYDRSGNGCTTTVTAASFTSSCRTEQSSAYGFSLSGLSAGTYTLQATPVPSGSQSQDSCGMLTLNQTGAKTPSTQGCW